MFVVSDAYFCYIVVLDAIGVLLLFINTKKLKGHKGDMATGNTRLSKVSIGTEEMKLDEMTDQVQALIAQKLAGFGGDNKVGVDDGEDFEDMNAELMDLFGGIEEM